MSSQVSSGYGSQRKSLFKKKYGKKTQSAFKRLSQMRTRMQDVSILPSAATIRNKLKHAGTTIFRRYVQENSWVDGSSAGLNQPNGWYAHTAHYGAGLPGNDFQLKLVGTSGNDELLTIGAAFCGADLQNWNEIMNMYDQFRILKVIFTIECRSNAFQAGFTYDGTTKSATFLEAPYLYITEDPSDADGPITSVQLQQYDKCRKFCFADGRKFTYVLNNPSADELVYNSTASGGNAKAAKRVKSPWLSTDEGGYVPHYGLKMYLKWNDIAQYPDLNNLPVPFTLSVQYVIECRDVR